MASLKASRVHNIQLKLLRKFFVLNCGRKSSTNKERFELGLVLGSLLKGRVGITSQNEFENGFNVSF